MDPRLRQVLLVLLQLAVEQETQVNPLEQPAPEQDKHQYAPGTLGYDLQQLAMPQQHRVWPFGSSSHDFGEAC